MAVEIFLPKMSDHMESGVIVRWLAAEGDAVQKGQILAEVETDKATAELESPAAGFLRGVRAQEGATVPVGATLAFVAAQGEEVPLASIGAAEAPAAAAKPEASDRSRTGARSPSPTVLATPAARRVAKELGLDLSRVTGTASGGMISEQDVRGQAGAEQGSGAQTRAPDLTSVSPGIEGRWLDLSPTQLRTGELMLKSAQTIPQFSVTVHQDVSRMLAAREALARAAAPISLTAVLIRLVATALKRHLVVNSSFEGGRLKIFDRVNVAVAMATSAGLVAPVLRDANRKSLPEIARGLGDLKDKARERRLHPDDVADGTFTLSNLGMFNVDQFVALVNPPQAAILAVGRIRPTAMGLADGTLAFRPVMSLTLSADHRCLDGAQAASFLMTLQSLMEEARLADS